jgi:hypothetical protein
VDNPNSKSENPDSNLTHLGNRRASTNSVSFVDTAQTVVEVAKWRLRVRDSTFQNGIRTYLPNLKVCACLREEDRNEELGHHSQAGRRDVVLLEP